jgi:multidrug transporter EmrE-like cation transporter
MFAWILLALAAISEIGVMSLVRLSAGYTKLWPVLLLPVAIAAVITCLSMAMKTIPLPTAYPIWVSAALIGTTTVGVLVFREQLNGVQVAFLGLLLVAMAGFHLSASPAPDGPPPETGEAATSDAG